MTQGDEETKKKRDGEPEERMTQGEWKKKKRSKNIYNFQHGLGKLEESPIRLDGIIQTNSS